MLIIKNKNLIHSIRLKHTNALVKTTIISFMILLSNSYCFAQSNEPVWSENDSCYFKNLLQLNGYGAPYIVPRIVFSDNMVKEYYLVAGNDYLFYLLSSFRKDLNDKERYNLALREHFINQAPIKFPSHLFPELKHQLFPLDFQTDIKYTFELLSNGPYKAYQVNIEGNLMFLNYQDEIVLDLFNSKKLVFKKQNTSGLNVSDYDCKGNGFFIIP